MNAAVSITDLFVAFSGRKVLRSVNAVFPTGAVTVVVGRSGSGKTTLLRSINRLNEEFPGCATSGRVMVDFGCGFLDIYEDVGPGAGKLSLSALRLRVGMLFQTPNCFPVSVYRNLALPLSLAASIAAGDVPDMVRAALESVGLWAEVQDRLHAPAHSLSGGQQQRLCLARLLALRPAVLLLDEPTASLDVHAASEIEELLRGLAGRYTIIMVSHGLLQARRMADQVLICESGEIVRSIEDPALLTEEALTELTLP